MEGKEKKAQEVYSEFQILTQHIKQLQSQLEVITQQRAELNATSNSLDEIAKVKEGKEVFVPLSSGIFVKANIKNTSDMLVNVGANVVVKKDLASAKMLIQTQMEEMKKIQKRMLEELEKLTNHAANLEAQLQGLISEEQTS